VDALCVALSDVSAIGALNMGDRRAGGAHHAFGVTQTVKGEFTPQFSQAVLGLTADDAIERFGLPAPQHIKLDVDSIEDRILAGAARTLRGVQSLLIEVESVRTPAWREGVRARLGAAGLKPVDETAHNVCFIRAA